MSADSARRVITFLPPPMKATSQIDSSKNSGGRLSFVSSDDSGIGTDSRGINDEDAALPAVSSSPTPSSPPLLSADDSDDVFAYSVR